MKEAGLSPRSEESGSFRDFSETGIERRREAGYRIAQLKLQELFEAHGLLPARH
jgi:NTE family protein